MAKIWMPLVALCAVLSIAPSVAQAQSGGSFPPVVTLAVWSMPSPAALPVFVIPAPAAIPVGALPLAAAVPVWPYPAPAPIPVAPYPSPPGGASASNAAPASVAEPESDADPAADPGACVNADDIASDGERCGDRATNKQPEVMDGQDQPEKQP